MIPSPKLLEVHHLTSIKVSSLRCIQLEIILIFQIIFYNVHIYKHFSLSIYTLIHCFPHQKLFESFNFLNLIKIMLGYGTLKLHSFLLLVFQGLFSWHKIIINYMKISQSTLPKVATFNTLFIKNIIRLIILYTN